MGADAGIPLKELRVDGGAAGNDLLMQIQADLLGVPVVRPAVTETTALGAAYLAGLAVGLWKSPQVIAAVVTLIPNTSPRNNDLGYSSLCPFAPWSTLVLLAGAGVSWAVRAHLSKPDAPKVRI